MADIKEVIDGIKDIIIKPVQESVSFKARSAFFGTFVTSWLVLNWDKIAYFFMSDDKVLTKIYLLKGEFPPQHIEQNHLSTITQNLTYPFLAALAFTFLYPFFIWLTQYVHKWIFSKIEGMNENTQKETVKRRQDLDHDIEESEGLKNKIRARIEREISEDTLNAFINNERTDELRKELSKNRAENDKLISQTQSNHVLIENQEGIKINLEKEINGLTAKLGPLKEANAENEKIITKNKDLEARLNSVNNDLKTRKTEIIELVERINRIKINYQDHMNFENITITLLDKIKNQRDEFHKKVDNELKPSLSQENLNRINEFLNELNYLLSNGRYNVERPEVMSMDHNL